MKKIIFLIIFIPNILFSQSKTDLKMFKSVENYDKFKSINNQLYNPDSLNIDSVIISTDYGDIFITSLGNPRGKKILMFHAMAVNSNMWWGTVKALEKDYHVFMIDYLGDFGKSRLEDWNNYPDKDEKNKLIDLVLDSLKIDSAIFIGASYGGWVTLSYAVYSTERIESIILLGPMGVAPVTFKVLSKLFKILIFPTEKNRHKLAEWTLIPGSSSYKVLYDYFMLTSGCKNKQALPKTLKDREIQKINVPILLLLGELDNAIGDPKIPKERVLKLIPTAQVEIIEGAGHVMNIDNEESVNGIILKFLDK